MLRFIDSKDDWRAKNSFLTGHSRFSRSGDKIAGVEIENGLCTLATFLFGVVCHLQASTWYRQHVCKIWEVYSFSPSSDITGPKKFTRSSAIAEGPRDALCYGHTTAYTVQA